MTTKFNAINELTLLYQLSGDSTSKTILPTLKTFICFLQTYQCYNNETWLRKDIGSLKK